MGKSQLKQIWGFLAAILFFSLILFFQSCAPIQNKKTTINSDEQINLFEESCVESSVSTAGIVQGQKVFSQDPESAKAVLLIIEFKNGDQKMCSSTLIAQNVLLTAGHCLDGARKIMAVFHADITCASGYRKASHAVMVKAAQLHPEYERHHHIKNEADENPDLALLLLAKPAPARFKPFKILDQFSELNSSLELYGYGVTGTFKEDSLTLRKAVITPSQAFVAEKNLIIDQQQKAGICQGDSGGAGYLKDANNIARVATINSIVFSKDNSEDLCDRNAGLVVVGHYKSWIHQVLNSWNIAAEID